ncbi:MAG: ATP synthase F1 subunit delta [Acidobacteriota bacterium]
MAHVNDKDAAIARIYAAALLSAADKAGVVDEVRDELLFLARRVSEDEEFARFVASPLVDPDARRASLDAMFRGRLTDTMVDALQVLNRKDRLAILESLAEVYRGELIRRRGEVEVEVSTAVEVDDVTREKILATAKRFIGAEPILSVRVDEGLVGGFVLQVGDRKVDASVRYEIEKYRRRLDARASQELIAGRQSAAEG